MLSHHSDKVIYLPSEYAFLEGLDMTDISDRQLFDRYNKLPQPRIDVITALAKQLSQREVLSKWQLKLSPEQIKQEGVLLKVPKIDFRDKQGEKIVGPQSFISALYSSEFKMTDRWAISYFVRDFNKADFLHHILRAGCAGLDVRIAEPEWIELNDKAPFSANAGQIRQACKEVKGGLNLIVHVGRNPKEYGAFKKVFDELGIVS